MPQESPDPDADAGDPPQPDEGRLSSQARESDAEHSDADLSRRVDRLREQVTEQGLRGRDQRRHHKELAAASDERREAVLERIARSRVLGPDQ